MSKGDTPKPGQVWRTKAGGMFTIPQGINPLNFDLVEMVIDEDGFIIWGGGKCPVPENADVLVRMRGGSAHSYKAQDLDWHHHNTGGDVVAYKVIKAAEAFGKVENFRVVADDVRIDLGEPSGDRHVVTVEIPPGYDKLFAVLVNAFKQASAGKGKERHASAGVAFEDQPISAINRTLGSVDGLLYQAAKKSAESRRLPAGRAQAEIYGAINYLAAAAIAYDTWAAESLQKN